MKWNEMKHSLTWRLFSTIIVGMLILNLLVIYSSGREAKMAEENLLKEYRQILELYSKQLGTILNTAQEQITSISSSYLADMGTDAAALGDDRQYEAIRCQAEISSAMRLWLYANPVVTGYYLYGQEADVLIYQGDGLDSQTWFLEQLRKSPREYPLDQNHGWQLIDTPQGTFFIFNMVRRDIVSGAWLKVSHAMEALVGNEASAKRFTISGAEGIDAGSRQMFSPLNGTNYGLKQNMGGVALELPLSVRGMRVISFVMLLVLPASWLVLRRLVIQPMNEMIRAIHEIEQGNTSYRIPEQETSYEFDQLNRQFNRSMERIAEDQAAIYQAQLENDQAKIRYLTQQMQPHFVLNTLNLIYSMEPSQFPLIQKTIRCLSRYYRYIAHVTDPLVPLREELDHIRNFFELQTIRYPGFFSYEICCPEELEEERIPPVIIQTFAENAIKHSLTVGEMNSVHVKISRTQNNQLKIILHDSGKGYSKEVLEKIEQFRKTETFQEGLGLGIQNTMERIRLIYSSDAEIRFSNAENGGALVEITLPSGKISRRAS